MDRKERMEMGPGAQHARQEPLGSHAMDHGVDRQAVHQQLRERRGERLLPCGAIDRHARSRGEAAGVPVDEFLDGRARA